MKYALMILCFMFSAGTAFCQTQMELNGSAANKWKKADHELNSIYKKLMASINSKAQKDQMIKAQRAWILYRDAHCKYSEGWYEGGSMQPFIYFQCMEELTQQRIAQIKADIEERSGH